MLRRDGLLRGRFSITASTNGRGRVIAGSGRSPRPAGLRLGLSRTPPAPPTQKNRYSPTSGLSSPQCRARLLPIACIAAPSKKKISNFAPRVACPRRNLARLRALSRARVACRPRGGAAAPCNPFVPPRNWSPPHPPCQQPPSNLAPGPVMHAEPRAKGHHHHELAVKRPGSPGSPLH